MKQLLILSGKGGTGKTTIAGALIKLSEVMSYADCDVDAPNLHMLVKPDANPTIGDFLGMKKAKINTSLCIECGLCFDNCRFSAIIKNNVITVDPYSCEGCALCRELCPVSAISMVDSVAGDLILYKNELSTLSTARLRTGSGNSGLLVSEVKKQLKTTCPNSKMAIIDGSPGIGCPVISSINGVDLVLIVAEPSISGLSDLARIVKTARQLGARIATCVNKYDINPLITERIYSYCNDLNIPLVGRIPYDENTIIATNSGKSIIEFDCPAGKAVKEIYNELKMLIGKDVYENQTSELIQIGF